MQLDLAEKYYVNAGEFVMGLKRSATFKRAFNLEEATTKEALKKFHAVDKDGSKNLDWNEFEAWYNSAQLAK